ncbi:MAG: HAD family hydrolase [bacterium]
MSVKNIVFDLVGVLMRFDTEGYYRAHHIAPEDQDILRREVFRSLEWAIQDRGAITEQDATAAICGRVPSRLHSAVNDLIYRQNRAILPVPGMEALLRELKSAGYRLFLLSNTSVGFHRFRSEIAGIEYFDDELISADVGLVKPDPAFFRLACERFGILPAESAFIDDTPINAEAAHYIGMRAFVFNDDIDALKAQMKKAGICVSENG